MRVLLAGATGAIGQPLVAALNEAGHEVLALTRDTRAVIPGARTMVADVLDREGLLRAVEGLSADAVIHELTALRKAPAKYKDMDLTNTLRVQGTANLLEAARRTGARRFLTQSMVPGYGYVDHGTRPLTEADDFGRPRGDRTDPMIDAMRSTEQQVFDAEGIDGIALRYGAFYGLSGSAGFVAALRDGKLPSVRGGGGEMAWIHLADAATATVAALDKGAGGHAYNIVDDTPARWGELFTAHAKAAGTKGPRPMPHWLLRLVAPYFSTLMLGTSMRVSNRKAKAELDWTPRYPGYREGIASERFG